MAKRINKNLIIGLTAAGFIVTTVAGIAMVILLKQDDPAEFEKRAIARKEAEDYENAELFYRRAYQVSNDPTYLLRAGDMLYERGREDRALQDYAKAVEINPALLEAQEKLLDLNLEIADMQVTSASAWNRVKANAEAILEIESETKKNIDDCDKNGKNDHDDIADNPDLDLNGNQVIDECENTKALYAMGVSLLGLKEQRADNEDKGVAYLIKAVKAAPSEARFASKLAHYYTMASQREKSVAVLENLIAHTPGPGINASKARSRYAVRLAADNQYDEAINLHEEAVKLAGDDAEALEAAYVAYGTFWFNRWREMKLQEASPIRSAEKSKFTAAEAYDKAVRKFEEAIKAAPESYSAYLYIARMQSIEGDTDKAIATYEQRLQRPFSREGFKQYESRSNRYQMLLGLADVYVTLAANESAGTTERDALAQKAEMYVDDALSEYQNRPETSHLRGKIRFVTGKHREAVKLFEQAEQQGRTVDATNLNYLAMTRLQLGHIGAAEEAITEAISSPQAPIACWVTYAKVLLKNNKPREALAAANRILTTIPNQRDATLLKAAAQEQLGQAELASKTLQTVNTDNPALIATQVQFMAKQGQVDQALDQAHAALKTHPTSPELIEAIAAIYKRRNQNDQALSTVETALAKDPGNFDLQLLKLRVEQHEPEEFRKLYLELVNTIPDEYLQAMRLASFYEIEGDIQNQYAQLEKAKKLIAERSTDASRYATENTLRSVFDKMFRIAMTQNDSGKLDSLVAEAAAINDGMGLDAAQGLSYTAWRKMYNGYTAQQEAKKLRQEGQTDKAAELDALAQKHYEESIDDFKLAIERYPSSGQAYARLGEAYIQTDRPNDALLAFRRANTLNPGNGLVLKRLAILTLNMGDKDEYDTWLAECNKVIPDDPWVIEQSLANEEQSNPRQGIARREAMRNENPNDVANLLKLAELYQSIGDLKAAEKTANDILLIEPDSDSNRLAIARQTAQLFRKINKPMEALKTLEQALRDVPANLKATAQLQIGQHFAELGSPSADAAFLAAADIDPNLNVCTSIAHYFLRTRRPSEAMEWLTKAEALAAKEQPQELNTITQMRIEALIEMEKPKEAQTLCQQYIAENPDSLTGAFLDAQIEAELGNTDSAITKLSLIIEKNPRNPLALYRQAQYLVSLGRWQDAITNLEDLKATNAEAFSYSPRVLLAEAYKQIGRLDLAFQDLETLFSEHPEARMAVHKLIDLYNEAAASDDSKAGAFYAKADSVLSTLLNEDPTNVEWLTRSGEIAVSQKDRTKAFANLKNAAQQSGYREGSVVKVLEACDQLGAVDRGIDFYDNQVPPDRRTPLTMLHYAGLLAKRGDIGASANTFRAALHREGFVSFDFLSKTMAKMMSSFSASEATKTFLTPPDDSTLQRANNHILTVLMQMNGQPAEAEKLCNDLLASAASEQEKASILTRLGMLYGSQNDLEKAKAAYEQALAIDPNNLVSLNNLAYLLADKINNPEAAIPYAKHAASISNTAPILDTLGWAYLQAGQFRDAIAQLTKARSIDSDFPAVTYHLGEALRRDGHFEDAVKLLEEVTRASLSQEDKIYAEKAQESLEKARNRLSD